MIYDTVSRDEPIQQGDVFKCIPLVNLSLGELNLMRDGNAFSTTWINLIDENKHNDAVAIVGIEPINAIVITQDCDAVRSPYISLCEVRDFEDVEANAKNITSLKKLSKLITRHARVNQKWFYLPKCDEIGFEKRMGVDFRSVVRMNREDIEEMKSRYRLARLNDVARKHFRERIAEFFRRYPYDEWYPLTKEEFDHYKNDDDVEPFEWQK